MTASVLDVPVKAGIGNRATAFLTSLFGTLTVLGARVIAPHKASLRRLADIPLTVAGVACIDVGVFSANTIAGWIVTGLSLITLEHLIADEGEGQ